AGRLNMLFRDRRAHAYTRHLIETEARLSREAWVRSTDASDLARGEIMSLRTTVLGQMIEIRELHAADCRRQIVILEMLRADHRRSTEIIGLRTALQGQDPHAHSILNHNSIHQSRRSCVVGLFAIIDDEFEEWAWSCELMSFWPATATVRIPAALLVAVSIGARADSSSFPSLRLLDPRSGPAEGSSSLSASSSRRLFNHTSESHKLCCRSFLLFIDGKFEEWAWSCELTSFWPAAVTVRIPASLSVLAVLKPERLKADRARMYEEASKVESCPSEIILDDLLALDSIRIVPGKIPPVLAGSWELAPNLTILITLIKLRKFLPVFKRIIGLQYFIRGRCRKVSVKEITIPNEVTDPVFGFPNHAS
nr:hypothetical protein [Tanacetum cinerariifolium]